MDEVWDLRYAVLIGMRNMLKFNRVFPGYHDDLLMDIAGKIKRGKPAKRLR